VKVRMHGCVRACVCMRLSFSPSFSLNNTLALCERFPVRKLSKVGVKDATIVQFGPFLCTPRVNTHTHTDGERERERERES
jgi:hypothetical protein